MMLLTGRGRGFDLGGQPSHLPIPDTGSQAPWFFPGRCGWTARLNGLEPYAWIKDTLEKLPVWPNSRIDELLPLRRPKPT